MSIGEILVCLLGVTLLFSSRLHITHIQSLTQRLNCLKIADVGLVVSVEPYLIGRAISESSQYWTRWVRGHAREVRSNRHDLVSDWSRIIKHLQCLCTVWISVTERTKFVMKPSDVAAKFPSAATFRASAVSDADTPVTYTWYHNGHQLVSDNITYYMDTSGNLTVLDTDVSDLGEYKCVASNGISSVSITAKLYLPADTGDVLDTVSTSNEWK